VAEPLTEKELAALRECRDGRARHGGWHTVCRLLATLDAERARREAAERERGEARKRSDADDAALLERIADEYARRVDFWRNRGDPQGLRMVTEHDAAAAWLRARATEIRAGKDTR